MNTAEPAIWKGLFGASWLRPTPRLVPARSASIVSLHEWLGQQAELEESVSELDMFFDFSRSAPAGEVISSTGTLIDQAQNELVHQLSEPRQIQIAQQTHINMVHDEQPRTIDPRKLPNSYAARRTARARETYPFQCSFAACGHKKFLYYDSAKKHIRHIHRVEDGIDTKILTLYPADKRPMPSLGYQPRVITPRKEQRDSQKARRPYRRKAQATSEASVWQTLATPLSTLSAQDGYGYEAAESLSSTQIAPVEPHDDVDVYIAGIPNLLQFDYLATPEPDLDLFPSPRHPSLPALFGPASDDEGDMQLETSAKQIKKEAEADDPPTSSPVILRLL